LISFAVQKMPEQTSNNQIQSKVLNTALQFADNGWPVFPCNPMDKRPLTKHGFKDATFNAATIKSWWAQWPNAMLGVPMGKVSGIFCVDLDRKQGGDDGVASWQVLVAQHGPAPNTRTHVTPSTGQHYIFRFQSGIRNIPLGKLASGIEIKGEGGYIIMPPSKMADGREYHGNEAEITAAPAWLLGMMREYLSRNDFEQQISDDAGKGTQKEEPRNFGPISRDEIREALKNIPSDNYEDWYKIGAAIRHEFGDSGFDLFDEWSHRSKKYNSKDCHKKWKQIKEINNITGGTIIYFAEKENPGWRRAYQQRLFGDDQEKIEDKREKKQEQKTDKDEKPLILTSKEFLATYKPPDYMVRGLLQRRFVYSITGPTGSGKTCIALRLAAHVISGQDLNGRIVKKGKVLYFAGENPDDVLVRWIKLCEEMGLPTDNPNMFWMPGVPPLKNVEIRKRIYQAAKEIGAISLLIVDTSAAYFQGDDENNNTQLGDHARLMRSFGKLPGQPVVLVTCHPTKHPDVTNLIPRGGGAFLNEMDGNLSCSRENQIVEIDTHGKWRGPEFAPLLFKLVPCTLNELKDEDDNKVWSVVVSPISDEEHTSMEDAAERRVQELIELLGNKPGMSLAEYAVELGWALNDGRPNKALVQRIMKKLVHEREVIKRGGHYVLTPKGKKGLKPDTTEAEKRAKQEDLL
jgi:hypothetical protein